MEEEVLLEILDELNRLDENNLSNEVFISDVRNLVKEYKDIYDNRIEYLESELENAESEINSLEDELCDKENKIADLENEIEELEREAR